MEVEELQGQNTDAFTIPKWFLYTSPLAAGRRRLSPYSELLSICGNILLVHEENMVQNLPINESTSAVSAQLKDMSQEALVVTPDRIQNTLPCGNFFLSKPPISALEPLALAPFQAVIVPFVIPVPVHPSSGPRQGGFLRSVRSCVILA